VVFSFHFYCNNWESDSYSNTVRYFYCTPGSSEFDSRSRLEYGNAGSLSYVRCIVYTSIWRSLLCGKILTYLMWLRVIKVASFMQCFIIVWF